MNIDLSFLNQYNSLDLVLLAILVISVVVGLIRGVVREVLSVISWAVAIYVALRFAPLVSEQYLKQLIDNDYISYVVSFVSLIIVSLIAVGLVNLLLSQLFRVTGLSFLNRLLGMGFGFLRGVILGSVAIWVIGLVPSWTKEKWFIESTLVPEYRRVTDLAMEYLPESLKTFIEKQKDNPKLKELQALAEEKGMNAIAEQLKKGELDLKSEDVKELLNEIVEMQQKEAQLKNSSDPKYRVDNATDQQKQSAKPDNDAVIQLESTDTSNQQSAPTINLESTD